MIFVWNYCLLLQFYHCMWFYYGWFLSHLRWGIGLKCPIFFINLFKKTVTPLCNISVISLSKSMKPPPVINLLLSDAWKSVVFLLVWLWCPFKRNFKRYYCFHSSLNFHWSLVYIPGIIWIPNNNISIFSRITVWTKYNSLDSSMDLK